MSRAGASASAGASAGATNPSGGVGEEVSQPMFALVPAETQDIRRQLRRATRVLNCHRLKNGVKWLAELLVGLPSPTAAGASASESASDGGNTFAYDDSWIEGPCDMDGGAESDTLVLARSYFDLGEFQRCSHALAPAASLPTPGLGGPSAPLPPPPPTGSSSGSASNLSGCGFFLHHYAMYLAGERRKEEALAESSQDAEASKPTNPNLEHLYVTLHGLYSAGPGKLDTFGLYLYGVVLRDMGKEVAAREALCESVSQYPLNWSAWIDLVRLCTDKETLHSLDLVEHWTRDLFVAHTLLELQANEEALAMYDALRVRFPASTYLKSQAAQAQYNLREFEEAESIFVSLKRSDPFRLEGMDTYSNILYVKEAKADLSFLAHEAAQIDKFRPETCCIIGNYYSLRGEHEKAVVYFRRALQVNRRYLSAWTLMGHEFVEMKNGGAAIEAYRQAVDINKLDFRAWYGLGQTYEILHMFFYALHYYRKATALRPYDPRMWCAMAGCYEELERYEDAIKCYERASLHNDREGIAILKLAKLHHNRGDDDSAARCYKEHLATQERLVGNTNSADCAQAFLFLAGHAKDQMDYAEAERLASTVLGMPHPDAINEAKALLREIRSIKGNQSMLFSLDMNTSGISSVASPSGFSAGDAFSPFPSSATRGERSGFTPVASASRTNRSSAVTPVTAGVRTPASSAVTPIPGGARSRIRRTPRTGE